MADQQDLPDVSMEEIDDSVALPEPLTSNFLAVVQEAKRGRLMAERAEQAAVEAHQSALYDLWVWEDIVRHKLGAEEFLIQIEGYGPMTQVREMFNQSGVPRDAPQVQALVARLERIQESIDIAHLVSGAMHKGFEAKAEARRAHPWYSSLVDESATRNDKDEITQIAEAQLYQRRYSTVEALEGLFDAEAKLAATPMPPFLGIAKTAAEAAYDHVVEYMEKFLKRHRHSKRNDE